MRAVAIRLPKVRFIPGNYLQMRCSAPPASSSHPTSAHHRYNAGSKIVVVLVGLPTVTANQSRDEQCAGRRAARMMMG